MKKIAVVLIMIIMMVQFSTAKEIQVTKDDSDYTQMIADEEKVVQMLIKNGTIDEKANKGEIKKALNAFIKKKEAKFKELGSLAPLEIKRDFSLQDQVDNFEITTKKVKDTSTQIPSVKEESFTGEIQEDRVLAILINFPDYDGSTLTTDDTDMYYEDYSKEHYYDLLFGDEYAGPEGQSFVSMKAYYEQQSGGAYTVSGDVAGWYTAKYNASYYGGNDRRTDNDANPRALVAEALLAVAADSTIDLTEFDQEDRYDLDGDGDYREPDGLIDHIMIFHSSVGEEAGGGELLDDAIWSHSWSLAEPLDLGINSDVEDGSDFFENITAYDYTIQPIDAAAGVCAHEYGHDLGLPDEYDTIYSSPAGEPVGYWSIMSSGSWAGAIAGTEPSGFSPYAKYFFAATINPFWFNALELNEANLIEDKPIEILVDEAATKGTNYDAVKINVPDKEVQIINPIDDVNGHYYSTRENNKVTTMEYVLSEDQLSLMTGRKLTLSFDINYQIEKDWDYAYVYIQDEDGNETTLSNRITTNKNPNGTNSGNGITGFSEGWMNVSFDLSKYKNQVNTIGIKYVTDSAYTEYGVCIANVVLKSDKVLVFDDPMQNEFELNGFEANSFGEQTSTRYYLAEWRSHNGVDGGLKNIKRGDSLMEYDEGLVLWFVDNSYDDNHVALHPGYGFLGVVDASQELFYWSDGELASSKYLIHDAAFGLSPTEPMTLDYTAYYNTEMFLEDLMTEPVSTFDDSFSYITMEQPESGKILLELDLKIKVLGSSKDQSVGKIQISK